MPTGHLLSLDSRSIKRSKLPFEPAHDKTNKITCGPSEDSDQSGHSPSLIKFFAVRMKKFGALATHKTRSEDFDQTSAQSDL